MTPQLRLSLFRVPVRVDAWFFVVAAMLGLAGGRDLSSLVIWVAVVFVSVIWHEMGHALALRACKLRSEIRLYAFGGETSPEKAVSLSPVREIGVSVAGPAIGLALGLLVLVVAGGGDTGAGASLLEGAVSDVVLVNVGWGLFNLLPVLPLDGGRVMAAVFALASKGRGQRAAIVASIVVAVGMAVAAAASGQFMLAIVGGVLAATNGRVLAHTPRPPSPGDLEEFLAQGYEALEKGAMLAASNRARAVLMGADAQELRSGAAMLLFWAHGLEAKLQEAAAAITLSASGPAPVLPEAVVKAAGGLDQALKVVNKVFETHPDDATGTLLGRALVEAGRLEVAFELLIGPGGDLLGRDASAVVGGALFRSGRFEDAARLGERTFRRYPHPVLGYNVACSWARGGSSDEALAWLGRAVDAGYHDVGQLDSDPDLVLVRTMPEFEQIRVRAGSKGFIAHPPGDIG